MFGQLKDWLTKKTRVEEVEAMYAYKGKSLSFMKKEWIALKEQIVDGDELWEFCSPPASWSKLCGRAGVVLVHQGEIVAEMITMLN